MEALNTPKNLALKVSQILEWGLNKKKLVGLEILKMGGNNEKGNKTFVRNNEWKSQMPLAHPPT
jgi:hypothetical protein